MEKFKEFANKFCLKELGIIFIVSVILYVLFYAKFDVYLIDVGREAYLPWQILKGQVLYKDIFNVYGPLGYQINAIAYAMLGIKVSTLYFMGFLNSLVILFVTFYIGRLFTDKKTAMCISGLTLFVCVYSKNFFNFIFVYSYSAVYALSGFLLSLLSLLFYIRDKKNLYLTLAFFLAGFAFANKIEYVPYFAFLFACLPFFAKKDWKQYLYSIGAFILMPVISFGVLFIQGVSIKDLTEAFVLIQKLIKAPATNYFYYNYGLYFNLRLVLLDIKFLLAMLKTVIPYALVLYGINFLCKKHSDNKLLLVFSNIFIIIASLALIIKKYAPMYDIYAGIFSWVGLVVLPIFFIITLYCFYVLYKNKFDFAKLDIKDKMFWFLTIAAILVSIKGFFTIYITCYGTFNLAALFLPFVIFFVYYVPKAFKFVDKDVFAAVIKNLCVAVMMAFLIMTLYRIGEGNFTLVKQPRGMVYMRNLYGNQNELIEFMRNKTAKDAKIVTIPEGAIINFLAQRDTDNKYYYLIPVNVQIFGKEKILEDFKKNPPDYFLLNELLYSVYKNGAFCSYARNVCDFIKSDYVPVYETEAPIGFTLYRYKKTTK